MDKRKYSVGNLLKFNEILWDYIIGNAMFILMNIQIPLFFLFIKVNHPLLLVICLGLISLNLIPSYTALKNLYAIHPSERSGIIRTYIACYRRLLKSTFPASIVVTGLLVLFYTDTNYFKGTPVEIVFRLLMAITIILAFNFMTLASRGSLGFQQNIALLRKYSIQLMLISILEIGIIALGILAFLFITKLIALVLFPIGIAISLKFYAPIRETIENTYPEVQKNWIEKE